MGIKYDFHILTVSFKILLNYHVTDIVYLPILLREENHKYSNNIMFHIE